MGRNQHTESRFFVFDTFTGLPENWTYSMKKGAFSAGGNIPVIEDSRVKIVKGLFQNSLRPFLKTFTRKNRMFIHLDADLFSSTLYVFTEMDKILSTGDILAFDEFSSITGEFKAFMDYKVSFNRKFRMISKVLSKGWLCVQVAFIIE